LERGHVREQIEMLKDHAGRRAKRREFAVPRFGAAAAAKPHLAIADADPAPVGVLEQIDAAQECRFAGAARPDDRNNRASFDM
jgi:hypothetical protein